MEWLIFAFLAVIFASAREITQKKALEDEHTLEYLVVRGFFIIIMALFLLPWVNLELPLKAYGLITVVALIAASAVIYRNKGLKHLDISVVQPLMNLQPLFVTLIAFIALNEKLTTAQVTGVLLIVGGTYALEIDHSHHGLLGPLKKIWESKYSLMVIGAIFIFSITAIVDRYILITYTNSLTYFVLTWIIMSVFIIAWHAYQHRLKNIQKVFKANGKKIFWPALFTVLMILSLYQALAMAYAGLVIAVYRLQSLVTTIEGGLFFHEDHLAKKSLACMVMVAGATLVLI